MKKFFKALGIFLFLLILSIAVFPPKNSNDAKNIIFSELINDIDKGKIKKIEISSNRITAYDKKERRFITKTDELSKNIATTKSLENRVKVEYVYPPFFTTFLTYNFMEIIIACILIFSLFFAKLPFSSNKSSFKVALDKKYTFDSIAGANEAKKDVQEVINFLKKPEKFKQLGAEGPKGILLYGPPGTGKTLLAKAVACETGCNFLYASGSEFDEVYVGIGAGRIRKLFEEAEKNAPCIIFIDEIDSLGHKRGKLNQSGDQTLNELLTQLDGLKDTQGIVVFASTNRPDILDPALIRPGRLGDRIIEVPLPSYKQRIEILKLHMKNISCDQNMDLSRLAKITSGLSGADLKNIVNEAALLKTSELLSKDQKITDINIQVSLQDLYKAVDKIQVGAISTQTIMSDKDKKRTAYHEAGHALISHLCTEKTIHKITILPRGRTLGFVFTTDNEDFDKVSQTKLELLNAIKVCFGGIVAEEIIFNDISSGPRSDLAKATNYALHMVSECGMSNVGLANYSDIGETSEKWKYKVEEEVVKILANEKNIVINLINKNKDLLERLAALLLEKEELEEEEIKAFFNPTITTESDAESQEKKQSDAENNLIT